jgi:GATA-binding protein
MNPTMTEHDFRFPRRPNDDSPSGTSDAASPANSKASADLRASLQELKLDISATYATAHDELLRTETFPAFQSGADGGLGNMDELRKQDPFAAQVWSQVWKFYTKTKQLLPDQRRMENLTWRMMQMRLQKSRLEQNKRYAYLICFGLQFPRGIGWFWPVLAGAELPGAFARGNLHLWCVR